MISTNCLALFLRESFCVLWSLILASYLTLGSSLYFFLIFLDQLLSLLPPRPLIASSKHM